MVLGKIEFPESDVYKHHMLISESPKNGLNKPKKNGVAYGARTHDLQDHNPAL